MPDMEDTSETKNYEITFFVGEENSSPILSVFAKHGVRVTEEKPFQKITFAYPVRKQTQCFMGIVRFIAAGPTLPDIIGDLKLEKNVLRFVIGNIQNKKELNASTERKKEAIFVSSSEDGVKSSGEKKTPRRFFEKILTNEALEKKIEEMLQ